MGAVNCLRHTLEALSCSKQQQRTSERAFRVSNFATAINFAALEHAQHQLTLTHPLLVTGHVL